MKKKWLVLLLTVVLAVGVESVGSLDTIAPAVQKGNTELLNWINDEIESLEEEQFFHKDF